ncbi:hypothetical protein K431DRAFT_161463 [Polychaeton citri CBS 116435]|uniref:Uncharacterized protein n=1 Tax=Polychaeton citri CBS 116435 TaxID=1314669 RepID=A0A9P4PYA6_9PEZI|nr:hypothetical protein K431DRAFT_161463 [Polychaeton citri CBS 116435]
MVAIEMYVMAPMIEIRHSLILFSSRADMLHALLFDAPVAFIQNSGSGSTSTAKKLAYPEHTEHHLSILIRELQGFLELNKTTTSDSVRHIPSLVGQTANVVSSMLASRKKHCTLQSKLKLRRLEDELKFWANQSDIEVQFAPDDANRYAQACFALNVILYSYTVKSLALCHSDHQALVDVIASATMSVSEEFWQAMAYFRLFM